MWMQAQNLVPTGRIDFGAPLGALLAIGLLLVTALGVLFEGGAFAALLGRLAPSAAGPPAPIATAPQRGRA